MISPDLLPLFLTISVFSHRHAVATTYQWGCIDHTVWIQCTHSFIADGQPAPSGSIRNIYHMVAEDPHIFYLLWLGNPYFQLLHSKIIPCWLSK
jgi:hypothetical protein